MQNHKTNYNKINYILYLAHQVKYLFYIMTKITWKPGNMLYPIPAVMVSCADKNGNPNIITIAWTGTINTNPPMTYISIRKERFSHKIIQETGEFVINLTTKELSFATDWCGIKTGKNTNKFKEMKLTPTKASVINAPLIQESPVNIECIVTQTIELGSHDMFLAKVVAVNVDEKYIDKQTNSLNLRQTEPIAYLHGNYYEIGKKIGRFGFSVKKNKKKRNNLKNNT